MLRLNGADDLIPGNYEYNQVCILAGSNIDPAQNSHAVVRELSHLVKISKISSIWETEAIGSIGENFLNFALLVQTELDLESLKTKILRPLEEKLGRVRSADKNAPRTMDLDVVLFNGVVIDEKMWEQYFIALPVSELFPDLIHDKTQKTLAEISGELAAGEVAICRNDLMDMIYQEILKDNL